MKLKVNFKCRCGGKTLEEVLVDVIYFSPVDEVELDSPEDTTLHYASPDLCSMEGGEVREYRCSLCGDAIPDCDSPEQLYEFLEQSGMLEEIK